MEARLVGGLGTGGAGHAEYPADGPEVLVDEVVPVVVQALAAIPEPEGTDG